MKWRTYDTLYGAIAKLELDAKRFSDIGYDFSSWQLEELRESIIGLKDKELTEELFADVMRKLKVLEDYYYEVSKEFESICSSDTYICFNTYSDNFVEAMSDELGDDDDILSYYYYDTNCSNDYDACIEETNGNKNVLKTFEDVYRYIKKQNKPELNKPTTQDLAHILSEGK